MHAFLFSAVGVTEGAVWSSYLDLSTIMDCNPEHELMQTPVPPGCFLTGYFITATEMKRGHMSWGNAGTGREGSLNSAHLELIVCWKFVSFSTQCWGQSMTFWMCCTDAPSSAEQRTPDSACHLPCSNFSGTVTQRRGEFYFCFSQKANNWAPDKPS